ncbi:MULTISPECIES: heavy-metal-associated domain-containing protein [Globicatella]|uniref:heavy-metal-associated domain-containing protein n=1 Tax=Globicatella TaxID=13075 RepID=UPI000826BF39|nr:MULTISPECIES: heavy metal-associated domain-containing protein [Globicatella]MDK7630995.1 heavy metal-associated domain-containing protein [Globicatella sanguinis]OFK63200.1 metal-binding protein [Globicatella sp. HMSC072A10]WIK66269.1 heavy metal-associated domain-containing protein [Globicatella sanguinis]WKT55674.1 heavy metal-associated domain-containing protein [Globicatella sanguinis]
MKQAIFKLETLTCPTCVSKIQAAINSFKGVDQSSIKVLFNSSKLKFNFEETIVEVEIIKEKIEAMGYQVLDIKLK